MSRYFEVSFNDLDFEKRAELIEEIAKQLKEGWKTEAEKIAENQGSSSTWQDLFCKVYGIDESLRDTDYSNWEYSVDTHAEEQAEELLHKAFKQLEIEIEV